MSGLDEGKVGRDSLDHILENQTAHGIKTCKKKYIYIFKKASQANARRLEHLPLFPVGCEYCYLLISRTSVRLRRLCIKLLLSYANVYLKQIHALCFRTSVEGPHDVHD